MTTTQHILVVDDDIYLVQALAISLRAFGYGIDVAGSGAEALTSAAATRPHLVLVDLGLPDMDGVDLILALRARSAVPIVWVPRIPSGSRDQAILVNEATQPVGSHDPPSGSCRSNVSRC